MIRFFSRILARNKGYINITRSELDNILNNEDIALIDVRSPLEFKENSITNAVNIPLYELKRISNIVKEKNKKIVLYCASGQRSKKAAEKLLKLGYTNVYNLKDGIEN